MTTIILHFVQQPTQKMFQRVHMSRLKSNESSAHLKCTRYNAKQLDDQVHRVTQISIE